MVDLWLGLDRERREKDETKDWKLIVRVKATSWWPDVAGINMLSFSSRHVRESFRTSASHINSVIYGEKTIPYVAQKSKERWVPVGSSRDIYF